MTSKELDSLLKNALNKKSKSLELYENIADNSNEEVQNMTRNIVSTEKKHEVLLQKMMQQVSGKDEAAVRGEIGPDTQDNKPKSKFRNAILGGEKFNSNLDTKTNIEHMVKKKHAERFKTVDILPHESCFISEYYGSQNFRSDSALFIGRYLRENDSYRSLLKFDLKALPVEARIIKAELVLDIGRNDATEEDVLVTVLGIEQDWDESNVTWQTQPENYDDLKSSVPVNPGYLGFVSIEMTDFVEGWQQQDFDNYGIIIEGCETRNSLIAFSSRQHENPNQWPVLKVEFMI
ncbi:MAG: DNRLRE domain-containing protein [Syntrophomonas sp.]